MEISNDILAVTVSTESFSVTAKMSLEISSGFSGVTEKKLWKFPATF